MEVVGGVVEDESKKGDDVSTSLRPLILTIPQNSKSEVDFFDPIYHTTNRFP